jgi:hypothetical protein
LGVLLNWRRPVALLSQIIDTRRDTQTVRLLSHPQMSDQQLLPIFDCRLTIGAQSEIVNRQSAMLITDH